MVDQQPLVLQNAEGGWGMFELTGQGQVNLGLILLDLHLLCLVGQCVQADQYAFTKVLGECMAKKS